MGSHQTLDWLNLLVLWTWTSQAPSCEKYISVIHKPSSLWHFAITAHRDKGVVEESSGEGVMQAVDSVVIAKFAGLLEFCIPSLSSVT